ncbi:hypothetical protein JHK82_028724 [Glycine max]|uniref:Uncharacterized protein n=2 Tax=Glycine subgen. Soja TaxID=1462606 RepID=K7LKH8_SOYBN|nr:hypothetical protein JHK82_028724 [Glycine max]KAH1139201.1 hypothetical protein GYH30_028578 [Glycine max]KHN37839.1 hypothetical protein glysoja_016963 [Glycine soja]RZB88203.1 hypothetical protein D0Y65_027619 [Glycine soja]
MTPISLSSPRLVSIIIAWRRRCSFEPWLPHSPFREVDAYADEFGDDGSGEWRKVGD